MMLRALVTKFNAKVRAAPLIGPVFNKAINDGPVRLKHFSNLVGHCSSSECSKPHPESGHQLKNASILARCTAQVGGLAEALQP